MKIAAPFKQINPFHCFAPSPHFNRVVQMVQLMRVAACKFWDLQKHLMMKNMGFCACFDKVYFMDMILVGQLFL